MAPREPPKIIEVEFSPVWRIAVDGHVREMDRLLVTIPAGIAEHDKLTHAAQAAGITHRHARNLIKAWSDFLGARLVSMQRGKEASLSALGECILWAGRRIESRRATELAGRASVSGSAARSSAIIVPTVTDQG